MSLIKISFVNWQKYNVRKDIKRPWWFALSNRITEDEQIQTLSDAEFRAFIHLLCKASQRNSGDLEITLENCSRITGLESVVFKTLLKKLNDFGVCTESVRHITLHNKTEHNTRESVFFEFSKIGEKKRVEWEKKFSDKKWRDEQIKRCQEYYRENPDKAPQSDLQWTRAIGSWLHINWARYKPSIKYPDAEIIVNEIDSQRGKDKRGDPEAIAKVKEMLAKTGKFGIVRRTGESNGFNED